MADFEPRFLRPSGCRQRHVSSITPPATSSSLPHSASLFSFALPPPHSVVESWSASRTEQGRRAPSSPPGPPFALSSAPSSVSLTAPTTALVYASTAEMGNYPEGVGPATPRPSLRSFAAAAPGHLPASFSSRAAAVDMAQMNRDDLIQLSTQLQSDNAQMEGYVSEAQVQRDAYKSEVMRLKKDLQDVLLQKSTLWHDRQETSRVEHQLRESIRTLRAQLDSVDREREILQLSHPKAHRLEAEVEALQREGKEKEAMLHTLQLQAKEWELERLDRQRADHCSSAKRDHSPYRSAAEREIATPQRPAVEERLPCDEAAPDSSVAEARQTVEMERAKCHILHSEVESLKQQLRVAREDWTALQGLHESTKTSLNGKNNEVNALHRTNSALQAELDELASTLSQRAPISHEDYLNLQEQVGAAKQMHQASLLESQRLLQDYTELQKRFQQLLESSTAAPPSENRLDEHLREQLEATQATLQQYQLDNQKLNEEVTALRQQVSQNRLLYASSTMSPSDETTITTAENQHLNAQLLSERTRADTDRGVEPVLVNVQAALDELAVELTSEQEHNAKLEAAKAALAQQVQELQDAIAKDRDIAGEVPLLAEVTNLRDAADTLSQQVGVAQERAERLEQEKGLLQKRIAELLSSQVAQRTAASSETSSAVPSERATMQAALDQLAAHLHDAQARSSELEAANSALSARAGALESASATVTPEAAAEQSSAAALRAELRAQQAQNQELQAELLELRRQDTMPGTSTSESCELENLRAAIDGLASELSTEQEHNAELEAAKAALAQQVQELQDALTSMTGCNETSNPQQLQQALQAVTLELTYAQEHTEMLEGLIAELDARHPRPALRGAIPSSPQPGIDNSIANLTSAVDGLAAELSAEQERNAVLEAELAELRRAAAAAAAAASAAPASSNGDVANLTSAVDGLAAELSAEQERNAVLEAELAELRRAAAAASAAPASSNGDVANLTSAVDGLAAELSDEQERALEAETALDVMAVQLDEWKVRVEQETAEVARLERALELKASEVKELEAALVVHQAAVVGVAEQLSEELVESERSCESGVKEGEQQLEEVVKALERVSGALEAEHQLVAALEVSLRVEKVEKDQERAARVALEAEVERAKKCNAQLEMSYATAKKALEETAAMYNDRITLDEVRKERIRGLQDLTRRRSDMAVAAFRSLPEILCAAQRVLVALCEHVSTPAEKRTSWFVRLENLAPAEWKRLREKFRWADTAVYQREWTRDADLLDLVDEDDFEMDSPESTPQQSQRPSAVPLQERVSSSDGCLKEFSSILEQLEGWYRQQDSAVSAMQREVSEKNNQVLLLEAALDTMAEEHVEECTRSDSLFEAISDAKERMSETQRTFEEQLRERTEAATVEMIEARRAEKRAQEARLRAEQRLQVMGYEMQRVRERMTEVEVAARRAEDERRRLERTLRLESQSAIHHRSVSLSEGRDGAGETAQLLSDRADQAQMLQISGLQADLLVTRQQVRAHEDRERNLSHRIHQLQRELEEVQHEKDRIEAIQIENKTLHLEYDELVEQYNAVLNSANLTEGHLQEISELRGQVQLLLSELSEERERAQSHMVARSSPELKSLQRQEALRMSLSGLTTQLAVTEARFARSAPRLGHPNSDPEAQDLLGSRVTALEAMLTEKEQKLAEVSEENLRLKAELEALKDRHRATEQTLKMAERLSQQYAAMDHQRQQQSQHYTPGPFSARSTLAERQTTSSIAGAVGLGSSMAGGRMSTPTGLRSSVARAPPMAPPPSLSSATLLTSPAPRPPHDAIRVPGPSTGPPAPADRLPQRRSPPDDTLDGVSSPRTTLSPPAFKRRHVEPPPARGAEEEDQTPKSSNDSVQAVDPPRDGRRRSSDIKTTSREDVETAPPASSDSLLRKEKTRKRGRK